MFETTTHWFDLSLFLGLYAVGFVLFKHFEIHTPRWRTLLKLVMFTGLFMGLLSFGGRAWAWGFIGLMSLFGVYVHAVALPRKGINGWTAEPRDKYYALRGWKLEAQ